MFKKTIVFIATSIVLILLASCEQRSETTELKQSLEVTKEVVKQAEQLKITDSNANVKVDQAVATKSVMAKISPDVLATLDILTDYNREFGWGPEEWDEELWAWKILLKWDQECDYAPAVHEYSLVSSQYKYIQVRCALGAYQPIYYAYLLDKNTKENVQLTLGRSLDSVDLHKDIWGDVQIDTDTNELSILTVAQGSKDCGTYRKLNFVQGDSVKTSNFEVKSTRKQECFTNPADIEKLPYPATDYKNWPLVDE